MAHEYSVQIHNWISHKIEDVNQAIKTATGQTDGGMEQYYRGQLQELLRIRQYLTDKVDLDTQNYYQ